MFSGAQEQTEKPRPLALSGHHAEDRKGSCVVDILRRLRKLVDPLDEQDDLLVLTRNLQPMTAKAQLGARGAIDVGDVDAAAVEIEAQPFERRDAHMAAVAAADRRMIDRKSVV